MIYKNLLEDNISVLGLGTLRLHVEEDGTADIDNLYRAIDTCMKGGVNYFDTGYEYARESAEEALKEALVLRYPREKFFLADKLHVLCIKTTAEDMFNEQLRRCGSEYFDFYLCHGITDELKDKIEERKVFDLIRREKKAGRIRHAGASFHSSFETFEYFLNKYEDIIEFVQLPSSYYSMSSEDLIRQYNLAKEKGKPVIAMSPLMGGFLGKIDNAEAKRDIKLIAKKYNLTEAQLAMAFAASTDNVSVMLTGAATEKEVADNIRLFENLPRLSVEERTTLIEAGKRIKNQPHIKCTQCGYCRSCPAGIDIPSIFSAFNSLVGTVEDPFGPLVKTAVEKEYITSLCTGCSKCRMVCPQQIEADVFIQGLCSQIESEKIRIEYPEFTPAKPLAYDLEGKVVSDVIDIRIAAENAKIPGPVNHIVAVRLRQKITGELVSYGFHPVKDDERTDFVLPLHSYENGIYEILIHSYYDGIKDGKPFRFFSEPTTYTFTLFKKKTMSVTMITAEGSSLFEYGEEPFKADEVKTYLNHIVDNRLPSMEKGMLLELGIMHSSEGLYHQVEAALVIDEEIQSRIEPVIFPKDEEGCQISGNKDGVVFIPAELTGKESVKVYLHFREFADKDLTDLIDETEEILTLDHFRQAVYLDFTEKAPSIFFSQKKEDRPHKETVDIYFKNVADEKHVLYVRVNEDGILSEWEEVNNPHHQIYLEKKGKYIIQAMVTNLEQEILTFKEEEREVFEKAKVSLYCDEKVHRGGVLQIRAEVKTKAKVSAAELLHKDEGVYISLRQAGPDHYEAKYRIDEKTPTGLHVLVLSVTLSDGSVIKTTETFTIKRKED